METNMNDQSWMITVEKKLTSIQKDIEFIKLNLVTCKHKEVDSRLKTLKWLIGILYMSIISILGVIISKIGV